MFLEIGRLVALAISMPLDSFFEEFLGNDSCVRESIYSFLHTDEQEIILVNQFIQLVFFNEVACAKDEAENQFHGKRYIYLTLLLSFPFQENLITRFHLSTKEEILTSHIQRIIDRLSV